MSAGSAECARPKRGRRGYVARVLQAFVEELRAVLKRHAPAHYERFPKARRPCATCAFNPSTDDWRGTDATAMHLMEAIEHGQPFYCHENLPYVEGEGWKFDPKVAVLCAGWGVVFGKPEAKGAFTRACMKTPAPRDRRRRELLLHLAQPAHGDTLAP